MNNKEVALKTIEVLKKVDKRDYSYMEIMLGGEKQCVRHLQNSAAKHPDMIVDLLEGIKNKTDDESIIAEINELLKCISK